MAPKEDAFAEPSLRERILLGAAAAFGRLGYASTRVEDVVLESGVSRPTFYKLFDNKDAVFLALSERHHRTIRERLSEAFASAGDPMLQIDRALDSFLRWRAELGPVGRVLDLEARSPGTLLSDQRRRTLAHVLSLVQQGLKRAGRAPVDPALLRALIAATENVADELFEGGPVPESVLQRAKSIALRLHLGALAQDQAGAPAAAAGSRRPSRLDKSSRPR
jgi:AcrR family transcriptional regulator